MELNFIQHNQENCRLIAIFAGWSTTPDLYADITAVGWDILLIHDYADDNLQDTDSAAECREIVSRYKTVFVVGWSLGVAVAEAVLAPIAEKITAAFAVNGTLRPVSDSDGIPEAIFFGTEANLNQRNLIKFQKRMSSSSDPYQYTGIADNLTDNDIIRMKKELRVIAGLTFSKDLPWRRAFLSINDRIFPYKSMVNFWKNNFEGIPIVTLESGHYYPISLIIKEITPDSAKIAKRFEKALPSYDNYAVAQNRAISMLMEMLPKELMDKPLDILEIGVGSGLMSKRIAEKSHIKSYTFIDLYPLPKFGICEDEKYIVADAELWVNRMAEDKNSKKFDLIISANTIQWFADVRTFFRNASNLLKPDGFLLCSTFLKGNLAELDVYRTSPLHYHSRTEIEKYLAETFSIFITDEETLELSFDSVREMFLHLKATGVGGGTTISRSKLFGVLPEKPALTYKPLYILANGKE